MIPHKNSFKKLYMFNFFSSYRFELNVPLFGINKHFGLELGQRVLQLLDVPIVVSFVAIIIETVECKVEDEKKYNSSDLPFQSGGHASCVCVIFKGRKLSSVLRAKVSVTRKNRWGKGGPTKNSACSHSSTKETARVNRMR